MINKKKVIKYIDALASSFDQGYSGDELEVIYDIGCKQLNAKEKEAFREGSLALFAKIGEMPIKAKVHEITFKKLIK